MCDNCKKRRQSSERHRCKKDTAYNDCLGYSVKSFRNLIMGGIKLELFQKIMQKTSVAREND